MSKVDYNALALPKDNPNHRPSRKKRLKADYKVLRPQVREDTYARDGGRCRCCFRPVWLKTDDPFMLANIHEVEGERKVSAIDVSLRLTITLCNECHIENLEKNRIRISFASEELKCNGRVFFNGRMRNGVVLDNRMSDPVVPYERFKELRAIGNAAKQESDDRP